MHFGALPRQCVPPLSSGTRCSDAIDFFLSNASSRLIAIVDENGAPQGALSRTKILLKASGRFGRALYDKRPVTDLMDPPRFVVGIEQSVRDIWASVSGSDITNAPDGYILVNDPGRSAGIVDGLSVLRAFLTQNVTLVKSLNHEVVVRRDAEREARRLADTDTLTGLSNRRVFIEAADAAVARGECALLACMDLDRSK